MEQIYRIGIDHGYGNIKTAHHIFESGVIERESASELAGMTVEYEGKFYEIGSTYKEYQMDKVWGEDYYILTLAALAKELKGRGLYKNISHVAIYAGNGYLVDASSSKGCVVFRPVYSTGKIVMCSRPSWL